jgi:hypothetical protein
MTSHNITYVELHINNDWTLKPMHSRRFLFQEEERIIDQEYLLCLYHVEIFFDAQFS